MHVLIYLTEELRYREKERVYILNIVAEKGSKSRQIDVGASVGIGLLYECTYLVWSRFSQ
jgi:hypothetical protein